MDPVVENESLSYVVTDGYTGTLEAVSYLVSRGHKRYRLYKGTRQALRYQGTF
jgi:DNA-binding LacI/PurR family transcriptional regulator